MSEKNVSLQADKKILEDDLKRWKAKTQVGARACWNMGKAESARTAHTSFYNVVRVSVQS